MSHNGYQPGYSDQSRSDEFQATDPNELNKSQRIKDINQSRQRVRDVLQEISAQQAHDGKLDDFTANTAFRTALENYIIEVEWIIRDPSVGDDEDLNNLEQKYWFDYSLGKMRIGGEVISFQGLGDIIEAPNPLEYRASTKKTDAVEGERSEDETYQTQISRRILRQGYRAVNAFLAEVELEITLEEPEDNTYGFHLSEDE